MMRFLKMLLLAAIAASFLVPATAIAKQADGKHRLKVVVRPKSGNGFLPGYRQPLALSEWRDRSPRYGGGDFSRDWRYWSGGTWRYGYGGPGFYRGQWNGGSFGPCYTRTPIGPVWNCGM